MDGRTDVDSATSVEAGPAPAAAADAVLAGPETTDLVRRPPGPSWPSQPRPNWPRPPPAELAETTPAELAERPAAVWQSLTMPR